MRDKLATCWDEKDGEQHARSPLYLQQQHHEEYAAIFNCRGLMDAKK